MCSASRSRDVATTVATFLILFQFSLLLRDPDESRSMTRSVLSQGMVTGSGLTVEVSVEEVVDPAGEGVPWEGVALEGVASEGVALVGVA